eukprot:NODE_1_length_95616_cov_0.657642.p60 type:complete len:176 gc:universal NODE_1_length_95616_cov_0.657642:63742-64269(+)
MSFDDDFDVPLTDIMANVSEVTVLKHESKRFSEHYYTIYPYYFNSTKLPKCTRSCYEGVDITIYHLTKTLTSMGYEFKLEWKRHPRDLFHMGRLLVFTNKKKRALLNEIGQNLPICFKEFDDQVTEFKRLADQGVSSNDEYLLVVDPFYVPTAMRKAEKEAPEKVKSKKSGKKKS